jgi:hypothetical protein
MARFLFPSARSAGECDIWPAMNRLPKRAFWASHPKFVRRAQAQTPSQILSEIFEGMADPLRAKAVAMSALCQKRTFAASGPRPLTEAACKGLGFPV